MQEDLSLENTCVPSQEIPFVEAACRNRGGIAHTSEVFRQISRACPHHCLLRYL